jgi:hypothetical protein
MVTILLAALLVSSGCYNSKTGEVKVGGAISFELPVFPKTGSHAVQIFSEMHYSPSYRSQEVPRILPPEGSVPVTGAEVKIFDIEALKSLLIQDHVANYDGSQAAKRIVTMTSGAALRMFNPLLDIYVFSLITPNL